MDNAQKIVAGITVAAVLVAAAIIVSVTLPSHGRVTGIGCEVYSNPTCTVKTSAIDWGEVDRGSTKQVTLYLLNTGNKEASLNMTYTALPEGCALTWNREGDTLSPATPLMVTLTLEVSEAAVFGDFNFDLTFRAIQK